MAGTNYEASCVCGNITYFFTTEIAPKNWPAQNLDAGDRRGLILLIGDG